VTVDLDTRLLRAFVTAAEELNFTRAARLFVAQQALSSQIQQLEARVGVKLFEHHAPRGVERGGRAPPAPRPRDPRGARRGDRRARRGPSGAARRSA
jgi:hypothetical protein